MSAIPSRLNYEINEVEFNFRVYKFVMCSSFLLPFCMAGWSWQTCFVRRAAFEFWYNEALASSPVPPLISTHSSEREMPLTVEVFTVENVYPFWLPEGRLLGGIFPSVFPSRGRTAPGPWSQSSFLLWGVMTRLVRPAGGSEMGPLEEGRWRTF